MINTPTNPYTPAGNKIGQLQIVVRLHGRQILFSHSFHIVIIIS